MNTHLIGYDLNKDGKNYKDLIATIEATFGTWWHHLDSTFIVKSDMTCIQIRDLLGKHIDGNDELLVVQLSGVGAWKGFNQQGSDWLTNNL